MQALICDTFAVESMEAVTNKPLLKQTSVTKRKEKKFIRIIINI